MSTLSYNSILHIAGVQFAPEWEVPEANRDYLAQLFNTMKPVDIVVLPEMFASGFSLTKNCVESNNGETLNWMKQQATRHQQVVVGSVKVAENGNIYNRLYWVQSDGEVYHYDKVHLFGKEDSLIEAGNQQQIIDFQGFRFFVQTCYDLRFPVFCRNFYPESENYDVLINIASWPKPRIAHWNALLKARAIENLSYVVGVNRIGDDANDWQYVGESQVIAADGNVMAHAALEQSEVIYAELDKGKLLEHRKQYPFLKDGDVFDLKL